MSFGSKIAGLRLANGQMPPWNVVLAYEAEVRSHAYKLVRDVEAGDLAAALSTACKAPEVTTAHFIVPFTIAAAGPAALPPAQPLDARSGRAKGSGKGFGKKDTIKN